jgi:pimeloyl-ACP methyl ester carboxylesterase
MPTANNRGVDLHYVVDGSGATVAFVNDVGYGAWLWAWQYDAVAGPFEALVWDLRGTGRSDAPEGPYDVRTLAADLEIVLADHGVGEACVVGAGLGGMVALEYARRYGRADALALFGTGASGDAVDREALDSLFAPRTDDTALRASLESAFAASVDPAVVDRIVDWRRGDDADRAGWTAQTAAMTGFDLSESLYEITTPARVFHGERDAVVPVETGRKLAERLPRGSFTPVDGGHLSFVESARAVDDALLDALEGWT